jgi:hypothetical protein
MYTLILVFVVSGSVATTNVPGFADVQTCEVAAKKMVADSSTTTSFSPKIFYSCVKMAR